MIRVLLIASACVAITGCGDKEEYVDTEYVAVEAPMLDPAKSTCYLTGLLASDPNAAPKTFMYSSGSSDDAAEARYQTCVNSKPGTKFARRELK